MLQVTVAGGTNAGRKRPAYPPKPWTCPAGHSNPAYAATCLGECCREKRVTGLIPPPTHPLPVKTAERKKAA